MSLIQIKNLTFRYDNGIENIFDDVSVNLDTNWKLGLIGRNGKGKTTLLQILCGKLNYAGKIIKNVDIDYFPFKVNENKLTIEVIQDFCMAEDWKIIKELNILNFNIEALYRAYKTLSGGEKVKAMLVALFLKDNNFLLIDEPTNHLDDVSKLDVEKYLKNKKGFILVSHDRGLLNEVTDHIMAINNSNIDIIQGNYSVWKEAFDRQNNFELKQNEKLGKEIKRLENASKESKKWSNTVEKEKQNKSGSKEMLDKGFLGHKAAKIMKKSKVLEERKNKNIQEAKKLLSNVDNIEKLKIVPLLYEKNELITATNFQIEYEKPLFKPINFSIQNRDRICIKGKNGAGKSSIIKAIVNKENRYKGILNIGNNLKISYVPQDTHTLKGSLKVFIAENKLNESVFRAMLVKMGISQTEMQHDLENLSEGQKKKILLGKSISENAHIYIWDEPLNYIDIQTREQIENMILEYMPTLLFIEHDEMFCEKVSNKPAIILEN